MQEKEVHRAAQQQNLDSVFAFWASVRTGRRIGCQLSCKEKKENIHIWHQHSTRFHLVRSWHYSFSLFLETLIRNSSMNMSKTNEKSIKEIVFVQNSTTNVIPAIQLPANFGCDLPSFLLKRKTMWISFYEIVWSQRTSNTKHVFNF